MPHVDHITIVDDFKEVEIADWETVGRVPIKMDLYPDSTKAILIAVLDKNGGGSADCRLYDYFGVKELASESFSNSPWQAYSIALNELPTPNGNGIAFILFQMKTDGTGAARTNGIVLEMS